MKKLKLHLSTVLLFLVALSFSALASCSNHASYKNQEKHEIVEDGVFVCTGPKAKRYHSVEDCMGLSKCKGEVVEITIEEAEERGKTPCHLCVE